MDFLVSGRTMKRITALTMVFFFLVGCASTTLIKSNPPGAKLQVDGKIVGETPHFYTDKAVAGTVKMVTLKKKRVTKTLTAVLNGKSFRFQL